MVVSWRYNGLTVREIGLRWAGIIIILLSATPIYDPRVVSWGQGARTRLGDIVVPSKSLLLYCVSQGRGGDKMPGIFGRPARVFGDGGGIHNGKDTVDFIDEHSRFYSTLPIREGYAINPTCDFTYPPLVRPAEAEWWTMPYYPDAYRCHIYNPI